MLADYLHLLLIIFEKEPWVEHSKAVGADPALQQAIVDVLVDHCLPAMAEALQAEAAEGPRQQDRASKAAAGRCWRACPVC